MTNEEKQLIKEYRVMICGTDVFVSYIEEELNQLGFVDIATIIISEGDNEPNTDILIEFTGNGPSRSAWIKDLPAIYPFDFIHGSCAFVVFPGDDRSWLEKQNLRQWVADYVSGYCAFWNVEGCDWLHDVLSSIRENETSMASMKTAAYICARIIANIAVGRTFKRFPRFYLSRNYE